MGKSMDVTCAEHYDARSGRQACCLSSFCEGGDQLGEGLDVVARCRFVTIDAS